MTQGLDARTGPAVNGGMKHILFLCLIAAPGAVSAACPSGRDDIFDVGRIMAALGAAPQSEAAMPVADQLWRGWSAERDGVAQISTEDDALNHLNATLDECPEDADAYTQRAIVHFQLHDYDEALSDLDRALQIMPQHGAALSGRALTLLTSGREEAAQAMLRESITLNLWLRYAALPDAPSAIDR